jgi:5'-methylthioadenosine phosphorylase
MWAIVGGSGFESFEEFEILSKENGSTPFGETSPGLARVQIAGEEGLFLPRHGAHHQLLPSEINYRANIFALKNLGASKILSISAIGSLKKEFKPGDMIIPHQYLDRTKGFRKHSFCGNGVVGHVSLAKPVSLELIEWVEKMSTEFSWKTHVKATYVCVEGPYFSTQAESRAFIEQGATIVGMTNFPEYALAREAGLAYLPACFVTDYDCWDDEIPHVTLAGVLEIMRQNKLKAFQLAKAVFQMGQSILPNGIPESGLRHGVFTVPEMIPPAARQWLSVLQK